MKWLILAIMATSVFSSSIVSAAPAVGSQRPSFGLHDAWDRTYDTGDVGNRPLIVLYEDKNSAEQNRVFKDELSNLAKGDLYKEKVVLLAIADLSAYNYWPARKFVRDAMKDESRKANTPIYCDWDSSAQKTFAIKRGVSNVMLYSREGKLLFAYEGAMPEAARQELLALLKTQLAP